MCRCIFAILLISQVLLIQVEAQEEQGDPDKTTSTTSDPGSNVGSNVVGVNDPSAFIDFTQERDYVDTFTYAQKEYIFYNRPRMQKLASVTCKEHNAKLASLKFVNISHFMAEALSETRLEMDTLWTAGELHARKGEPEIWMWRVLEEEAEFENITDEIKELWMDEDALGVPDVNNLRKCLGFGRDDHLVPVFRPLSCAARRPFICQRPRGSVIGESTHPGWIRLGERFYKIFFDKMNYDQSRMYCTLTSDNNDARLAVIVSKKDAQMLGRYLLIGRPSLENAWIGARWYRQAYTFKDENLILMNETDKTKEYPPWLVGKVRKPDGCLLLDRHLANFTAFVEAKCSRPRGRICYKRVLDDNKPAIEDVVFDEWGYRVVYKMLSWQESVNFCMGWKEKYDAKLVEITSANQRVEMLYVMGENRTALDHVWLGGSYTGHVWKWTSTNSEVDKSLLDHWVNNNTYQSIDEDYICLNMDRENHIKALFYGTECDYEQFFVCLFPKDKLLSLQAAEQEGGGEIPSGGGGSKATEPAATTTEASSPP